MKKNPRQTSFWFGVIAMALRADAECAKSASAVYAGQDVTVLYRGREFMFSRWKVTLPDCITVPYHVSAETGEDRIWPGTALDEARLRKRYAEIDRQRGQLVRAGIITSDVDDAFSLLEHEQALAVFRRAMLNSAQAAERLGVSERRARMLAESGRIPGAEKVDGRWIFPERVETIPGTRGPRRQ